MSINTPLTDHQREVMVLEQVAGAVESFTYHHRSHFDNLQSTTQQVTVTAHQNFRVAFHHVEESGAGRLPEGFLRNDDSTAVWQQVEEQKADAERLLPLQLEYWLEYKGTNPQAALQEGDCFQQPPPIGYDFPCHTCQGTGNALDTDNRSRCQDCDGTGWRHVYRRLNATITTRFHVAAATDHAESQQTLQAIESITDFLLVAERVVPGYQRSTENVIDRTFKGHVAVTILSFRAAGLNEEIIGYGTPPRVFDLKNIVNHLLNDTLTEIEQALHSTSRYLPWMPPYLNRLLTAFLASETNQRIGKRTVDGFNDGTNIAPPESRQTIPVDYINRAVAVLYEGIERIYWSGVIPGILALLFLPTLLLVIGDKRGVIHFGPLPVLIVGFGSAVLALALEQYGKWHVRQRIQHAFKTAVDDLLKNTDLLRRGARSIWVTALIGAVLGWISGVMILRPKVPKAPNGPATNQIFSEKAKPKPAVPKR